MSKVFVIIVAAGISQRFGKDKLLSDLAGKPVIWHTAQAFQNNPNVDQIVIVTNEIDSMRQVIDKNKIAKIITGGQTRQDSAYCGLKSLEAKAEDFVLIHNGANPLVTQKEINDVITYTKKYGAAVVGHPTKSTLKKVNAKNSFILSTVNRTNLWKTQTPQGIKYKLAIQVFKQAQDEKFQGTDDVQLVERKGCKVKMIKGNCYNIKITEPDDLSLARLIYNNNIKTYVGLGQDSHKFDSKKKPLILGNYKISATGGLEGNSDGDVVLHSLCNALSSAIGGHSLSSWSDQMCQKGMTDSSVYLDKIYQKVIKSGFVINNISFALEAGKPKLEKHLPKIQKKLAGLLDLTSKQIGLTVTSGEGLTSFGKGEGIQCVCFLSLGKRICY